MATLRRTPAPAIAQNGTVIACNDANTKAFKSLQTKLWENLFSLLLSEIDSETSTPARAVAVAVAVARRRVKR